MGKSPKCLKVKFLDVTTCSDSWDSQEAVKAATAVMIEAYGIVVAESKEVLKLASLYDSAHKRTGVLHIIPKGCIISRIELKEE